MANLYGFDDPDTLAGGNQNDELYGGAANDVLAGGAVVINGAGTVANPLFLTPVGVSANDI